MLGAHRVSSTVEVVAVVVGPGCALVHPALVAHGEHDVDVHERLLLGVGGFCCRSELLTPTHIYLTD